MALTGQSVIQIELIIARSYSQGSVVAEAEVNVLDHPDAEYYFYAAFALLDLTSLFGWPTVASFDTLSKFLILIR